MNTTDRRDVWARWFLAVQEDVIELANYKRVYTELRDIVARNHNLHGESVVWAYLVTTWSHYAASSIRRQVKIDQDAASMARCLQDIADRPQAVSRDWFVGRFAKKRSPSYEHELAEANRLFDEYSGAGGSFIDSDRVKSDLASLRRVAGPVEGYADKMVAHHDMKPPAVLPTLGGIHAAVDLLVTLLEKYYTVVFGIVLVVDAETAVGDDWKRLFRTAWIT